MPSSVMTKYNIFVQDVGRGRHNLNSDVLKIALTNRAPQATDAVLADIAEIAAGNGYPAGGGALAAEAYTQTGGVAKLVGNDVLFTASGGSFGPYRYAILYNSAPSGGLLIASWDYGSALTTGDGEQFLFDSDQVNGLFTVGA